MKKGFSRIVAVLVLSVAVMTVSVQTSIINFSHAQTADESTTTSVDAPAPVNAPAPDTSTITTPDAGVTTETVEASTESTDTTAVDTSTSENAETATTVTETDASNESTVTEVTTTETTENASNNESPVVTSVPVVEQSNSTVPTLTTDKDDYAPGETASILGRFFGALQNIVLRIFGNSEVGNHYTDTSVDISTDQSGSFTYDYALDNMYRPFYTVVASTLSGVELSRMTFTDAGPAGNLDQCSNGSTASPVQCTGSAWQNGNLNSNQAHYTEGDSAPYRMKLSNLPTSGSSFLTIEYDIKHSGKHAIDYLTSYNRTESVGNDPCSGVSPCTPGTGFTVPAPSSVGSPISGQPGTSFASLPTDQKQISIWNGNITNINYVSEGSLTASQSATRVLITFEANASDVVIAWGGHIGSSLDWGVGNSAGGISGSPYHMRFIELNGKGGNQDRSLSAGAIAPPQALATLTLVKQVSNDNGGTASASDWTLSASGPTPISGASGSGAVTGVQVDAGTYTLSESTGPSGYTASPWVCVGGAQSGSDITLVDGDAATCTITNDDNAPSLTLNKVVVNNSGGNADASAWTLTAAGSTGFSGVGPTVSNGASFDAGVYALSESGPTGYSASAWSCTGGGTLSGSSITLGLGQSASCTITNDDQAATLIVKKVVVNDNGGALEADDFTFSVNGGTATAFETDGQNDLAVSAGIYSVTEPAVSGYATTYDNCSNVVIPNGGTATCTITNNDIGAKLTVTKVVVNDNGGSLVAAAVPLFVDGGSVTTGIQNTFSAGAHTVSETAQAGYTATISGDCAANGTITLNLGDVKSCTITNDDQPGTLIVKKVVDNGNTGATTGASAFSFQVNGGSAIAFESDAQNDLTVNAGTYSVTEPAVTGYSTSYSNCSDVVVPNGGTATCTVTNTAIAPTLTVIKVVDNGNTGATFVPADFQMKVDGGNVPQNSAQTETIGSHTVTETGPSGYTAVYSGDCSVSGVVSLALADNKTCTITNTAIAPTLTLVKTVTNDNGGNKVVADFALKIDTTGVTSGVANTTTVGAHTASETNLPGYSASDWGGDCAVNGSVTLGLGENKTCTITNNDIAPTLTIVKTVVNDNGGAKVVSDFPLFVNGNSVTSGVANTLLANTPYTATETGSTGYTASAWGGDCSAGGTIALAPGENKTCTITNDDQPGTLIVKKVVVNDNGGTLEADDFTFSVNGGTAVAFEADGQNDLTVDASSYSVVEPAVSGYATTYDNCSNVAITNGGSATCTVTNDDVAPKLHLRKVVVNDNLGTASATDFTLTANGTDANDLSGTTPVDSDGTLKADTFVLSETGPANYSASDWVCVGGTQNGSSVTVGIGGEATCTITNDDFGTWDVRKVVVNDNGGTATIPDFSFVVNGTTVVPFSTSTDGGLVQIPVPPSALVYVTEAPHAGYTSSLSEGCGTPENPIAVATDSHADCTVTNNDIPPSLTLVKQVINDNGGTAVTTDWTLTATGPTSISGAGGATSDASFDQGSYTLSESTGPSGYTASDWVCVGDGTQNGSSVTLGLGETATCTITNNDVAPRLTVIKHVITDNGGTATASDFTMNITGTNVSNSSFAGSEAGVTVTLNQGSYSVGETTSITGYTPNLSADCASTISVGETKTCTITNDDQPGHLKIVKNTVGGNGTFDFTVTGPTASTPSITTTNNTGDTGLLEVNAGSYSVTETVPAGWDLTSASCDSGTPANFTVPNGGTVTCTFEDTARGRIVVTKATNPSTDTTTQFAFTTTGTGYTAGFTLTGNGSVNTSDWLVPGTFTVTETPLSGWDLSSLTCDNGVTTNGGDIAVAPGQTVNCTFTNTQHGHLIVQKTTLPGGDATVFNVTASGTGTVIGGGTGTVTDATDMDYEVTPGTYNVSEAVLDGWDKTGDTCQNVTVGAGETVTCLLTNTKRGTITVIKRTDPVNDPMQFGFTTTGTGYDAFNLTGQGGSNRNAQTVKPGAYSVTEGASSWRFVSLTCNADASSNVTTNGPTANITLGAGGDVTCTYVNASPRMTGGGSVITNTYAGPKAPSGTRVTHGFELHCSPDALPNRLQVNWGNKPENNFHLTSLTTAACTENPDIDSGRPRAPFNTYTGTGVGKLNNKPNATASWVFTDAGEPGKEDTVTITIKDAGGTTVLNITTALKLSVGNQQAH